MVLLIFILLVSKTIYYKPNCKFFKIFTGSLFIILYKYLQCILFSEHLKTQHVLKELDKLLEKSPKPQKD